MLTRIGRPRSSWSFLIQRRLSASNWTTICRRARGRRWPFCWSRWVPVLSIVFRGELPQTHTHTSVRPVSTDEKLPDRSYQRRRGTIRPGRPPLCFSRWNSSTVRKPHDTDYRQHAPLPNEEAEEEEEEEKKERSLFARSCRSLPL